MNELLKIWVSLSFSGTLLILLFFLCKPLWRERTSKRWQYYIWLIVILRLLLPFTPETSPVGSMFASLGQTMAAQTHRTPAAVPHDRAMPPDNSAKPAHPPAAESREPDSMFASLLGPTVPAAIGHSLWLVWLLVAAGLLIRKITIYQAFVKYMRAGRTEVSDTAWLDRLAEIGAQIGVKRPVELYTNRLISSPLLLGFFRPCIVLPTADLCASDFYYTVLHELVHERRRDMLYKWLVQLTLCLHWFNPAVYRMGQEISRACELACDEAVIRGLPPSGRRDYGDTLLRAVGAGGGYRDSIASVTLHESKKCLKERLEAMLHLEKVKRIKPVFAALLALCLLGGGFAMGAYSARPAWDRTTPGQLTDEGLPVMSAKNRACYDAYVAPVMVTGLLTHNFSP
ncbi:MAG: M56 family metallopeptidase, partial [Oscillospiraceae bacterium]